MRPGTGKRIKKIGEVSRKGDVFKKSRMTWYEIEMSNDPATYMNTITLYGWIKKDWTPLHNNKHVHKSISISITNKCWSHVAPFSRL